MEWLEQLSNDGLSVVVSSCTFFDEGYLLTEEFVYSLTLRLLTCSAAVSDSVRFKYLNSQRNATSFSR